METENINSCLMLAVKLDTPVSLGCVFDSEDLKDSGVIIDSHITLLYAQGKQIPREGMLDDVKTILGERAVDFMNKLREDRDYNILDHFYLDSFENDSDYIVLKPSTDLILKDLTLINKGLRLKYDVTSEFDYSPHITLAELKPGTAKKYLGSEQLNLILKNTFFDFEDLLLSYGKTREVEDRKQYYLTTFNSIPR